MANKTYDESSIEIHQGLEGCRRRPNMYIGELGAQGIQHLLRELVENSIDEFFEKQNSYIVVKVINNEDKTQTFIVGDKGRGIPVGKHKTGLNTLTAIMTILHAGGKFDDTAYKSSRGVNGVGISIVNALSRKCEVWTNRNNDWYYQSFEKGIATIDDPEYMESKPSIARNLSLNKGTLIKFTPDYKILSKDKKDIVKLESLEKWLYTVAFLNSGVKIKLIYNDKEIDYYNSEGPQAFVKEILPKDTEEIGKCFVIDNENLTVALQWTDYDEEDKLISYVSGAETESGGTHLVGLMEGLTRSFKNYSNKASALTSQDIKLGIVGFINYRLSQKQLKI